MKSAEPLVEPLQQESAKASERLLSVLTALVAETRPGRVERVSMSSHLERDLGLDSLARVELLLRVGSEFGRSLPESALAEAETAQDLLRFIASATAEERSTIAPSAWRTRAMVSARVLRRVAACALPRPSAIASAKLAKSTVNHRNAATRPANVFSWLELDPRSRSHNRVVSTEPTSTMNMTGFFAMLLGFGPGESPA